MDVASLRIAIQTGDIKKAEQELGKLESASKKTERATDDLAKTFKQFVVGISIAAAIQKVTASALEAEEASSKLQAVLKATGYAAGITKSQLDDMADSMAASTRFDDESIRNASSVLLTFRNVQGDTFKQGISLAADLSSVLGTDLNSSVLQVGKALNDPVLGVTALSRVGIQFTEVQKDQIKNFVETNQLAKAQEIILGELTSQVGGTAEAMNTGLVKSINDAKKSFDELAESIGRSSEFQTVMNTSAGLLTTTMRALTEEINSTGSALAGLTNFVFKPFDINLLGFDDGKKQSKEYSDELVRLQKRMATIGAEKQKQQQQDDAVAASSKELTKARMKLAGVDDSYFEQLKVYQNARQQQLITEKEYASLVSELAKKTFKSSTTGQEQKKAFDKNKELKDQDIKGWVEYADAVFKEADELNIALAKIAEDRNKEEERLRKEDLQGWVRYAEERVTQDFKETEQLAKDQIKKVDEQKKIDKERANEMRRDLSQALQRAFESGKNPAEALVQGFASTMFARLTTSISDAFADAAMKKLGVGGSGGGGIGGGLDQLLNVGLSALFGGGATAAFSQTSIGSSGFGSGLAYGNEDLGASFEGGGYTGPGSRSGGMDGRGGFMAMLHPNETVIDHSQGGGMGQIVYSPVINVDSRTDRGEVQRLVNQAVQNGNAQLVDRLQRQGRI